MRAVFKRGVTTGVKINGEAEKTYERFCKRIMKELVADCAKVVSKEKVTRSLDYYLSECLCDGSMVGCETKSIEDKIKNVWQQFPCMPVNFKFVTRGLSTQKCISIHRRLVDEYNDAVDRYMVANPELAGVYVKIEYMY